MAQARLAEIGPAPHLHFSTHEKLACWVRSAVPGQQHQRPQAQVQPDRRGRDLHQAPAGPGRLVRDPGPGTAAGPVQPAGPPVRRREEPRGKEEGDHRGRAHPAQDRLPGPQDQHALPGPGRRLLHPAGNPRAEAGTPGTPAAQAPPRLHRHGHHHPAGVRITTRRLTGSPLFQPARSRRRFRQARPARRTNQRANPAPATAQAGFAAARQTGPSFHVSNSVSTKAGDKRSRAADLARSEGLEPPAF